MANADKSCGFPSRFSKERKCRSARSFGFSQNMAAKGMIPMCRTKRALIEVSEKNQMSPKQTEASSACPSSSAQMKAPMTDLSSFKSRKVQQFIYFSFTPLFSTAFSSDLVFSCFFLSKANIYGVVVFT